MRSWWNRLLERSGADPAGFAALTRTFILMDLRGQHFAQATATKPHFILSPLFIVVGQCLTASALSAGFLFARVDVYFFAFVHLSLSLLILGTAVVVEFQEAALSTADLEVLGYRPLSPRTYAAARLANLLFYFLLLFLALNLFPGILGAALRDAGPWYTPAYLTASLAGNLGMLALLVVFLASIPAEKLHVAKQILSWTQIIAILIIFYGGQLMLRDNRAAVQVWGAFPPAWTGYLPSAWLARFVEDAAINTDGPPWQGFASLLGVIVLAGVVTVWRLETRYRTMQPVEIAAATRPMAAGRIGGVSFFGSKWLTSSPEERIGFWLCLTFLRRDPALALRCLFTFQLAAAALAVGMLLGQFGNPMQESDPARITWAILAVFFIPLSAPGLVFNLGYCRDSEGGWMLRAGPMARPFEMARGACKAVQVWVVTPLCLGLAVASALVWGDVTAALLHVALAWLLTWAFILASLWLIIPAWPFTLPPPRGAGLVVPPLPMAGLSLIAGALGTLHAFFARSPGYWAVMLLLALLACQELGRLAASRFAAMGEGA